MCTCSCRTTALALVTTAALLAALAWQSVLEVAPQVGFFLWSSCRLRLSIPGVKRHFDAVVHAFPQDAQPWVRDHFEARQPPVDRKNASVVLSGVHKTGSELAKKLVSVTCGQLSLCCNMMSSSFTSVDTLNTMLASPSEPLDLFFSNHFEWLPARIRAPYSHLVFWWRKPLSQVLSAFAYHGQGQEGGRRFPKSACAANGRPPTTEKEVRSLCHGFGDLCLDAHRLTIAHGAHAAGGTALGPSSSLHVLPPAAYAFVCDALRPYVGYDAMDAWPNRSAHASGLAAMAATFYFQSWQMARIMQSSLGEQRSRQRERASAGFDRDGRRALLVNLDVIMADYAAHVATVLDFVSNGLRRVPTRDTRGLADALSVYDVRHTYSIERVYETFVTAHLSSLDQAMRRALLDGLAAQPLARQAYQPILEMMGSRGALY